MSKATVRTRASVPHNGPVLFKSNRAPTSPGSPGGIPSPKLSLCEWNLVSLIAASGRRLSLRRLMAELTIRGFAHPKSTVQHALANLVKRGILESSRRSPRGYALAQPGPLSADGESLTG